MPITANENDSGITSAAMAWRASAQQRKPAPAPPAARRQSNYCATVLSVAPTNAAVQHNLSDDIRRQTALNFLKLGARIQCHLPTVFTGGHQRGAQHDFVAIATGGTRCAACPTTTSVSADGGSTRPSARRIGSAAKAIERCQCTVETQRKLSPARATVPAPARRLAACICCANSPNSILYCTSASGRT